MSVVEERKALKAWLEAEGKLDFELEREETDEAAIKLAEEAVRKARHAYEEAIDANDEPPPGLVERVDLANYLKAAWHGHPLTGAELELNQELGIEPVLKETRIPMALLLPDEQRLEFADAVTSISATPDDIQNINEQPIIERVWPMLLASQVGVPMRMVGTGKLNVRWATAGATANFVAPNTSRDTVAYALAAEQYSLTRITGGMLVTQESLLTNTGLRDAMSRDLQNALMDQIDNEIFVGDGSSPTRAKGLFEFIDTYANITENDDTADSYAEIEALTAKYVDQIYFRRGEGDKRIVMGVATGNFLHTVINTSVGMYRKAYDLLMQDYMLIEGAAGQTPAADAATGSRGSRQKAILIGNRGLQRMFVPIWNSVGLRMDETGDNIRMGRALMQVDTYMGLAYADFSGTAGTDRVIKGVQGLMFHISNKT